MASPKTHNTLRKYHRWLGFFLAGIIAVYATSGTLLIFRNTDLLQYEQTEKRQLAPELSAKALGSELGMRGFAVLEHNDAAIIFKEGQYDKTTGLTTITTKNYHPILQQLVNLHKATTNSPLYWLNISFALSLLFFVVSAFFMFLPKTKLFNNGLKIAGAGFVFAILMVFFGS
ncbi:MAG: hypothetical protein ACI8Z9_001566 [Paraglaciecola sp.]|jgi:hypothetical protein